MEKIRCPECGIEIEKGIKECPNCGSPLDKDYNLFKKKERKAIKWMKCGIGAGVIILVFIALILHIVGNDNKKERAERIVNYLEKNETGFVRFDSYGKDYIKFDSDGYCEIETSEKIGDATYIVKFGFFGKEYLRFRIVWSEGGKAEVWKLPVGKNYNNEIILLGKENGQKSFYNKDLNDNDEAAIYVNNDKMWIFLMATCLILLVCGVFVWNVYQIREAYKTLIKNKELKEEQERIKKEKETLSGEWDKAMEERGYSSKEYIYVAYRNYLWVANEKLYEAENKDSYINRYLGKTDLIHELSYNEIPVSDIQYYSKEGDVQYTTKISGGGGGGSSISGAVVGGLIAGETGAVIGSRQKVQEVTSETVKHDSRRTLIRYYKDKQINVISYVGFEVYDYLLKKIPEKDLLTIQLEKKPVVREKQNSDSIKDKLETIKQLYENELITKEEYEQKRNEILSKI
ncbi:MAG: zinc-ribbon domain-containing protein [Anaerobutyricum hallii]|uniref:SHOCT domain-containing protein n=1 Tax=Anaerobutyricum hallii TaxID=39488 RepID=UPI00300EEDDD